MASIYDGGGGMGGYLSNLGSSAGGWAMNNPTDVLSLGLGAAGTGFGIWDIVNANKQASARDFALKHWLMQHPSGSYMPQLSEAVRAAMVRPSASNMASAGLDPSGGAFTQGITDSMAKQYSDLYNQSEAQRLSDYGAFTAGQGQPRQSLGSVAGLPQALQNMQIMQALRQPMQQGPPGATMSPIGQDEFDISSLGGFGSQLRTGGAFEGGGGNNFGASGFGGGGFQSFYPQDAMQGNAY